MNTSMLRFLSTAGFLLILCPAICAATSTARTKYNFNPGWLVLVGDPAGAEQTRFDDSKWKQVSTPYAWNEDSAFRVSIHDLPTGVAWYRKHFRLPTSSGSEKVFIEFEGIRQAGEVYLNGQFIGRHEDGVMAFGFDLTAHLLPSPQENVLAVRTDNRWDYKERATATTFVWNNTNFYANYGGISKNVWLHITPRVYQTLPLFSSLGTTGTYIWASNFNLRSHSALITAESQVHNESADPHSIRYTVKILDADNKIVSEFQSPQDAVLAASETRTLSASGVVRGLHFWSWGYGYLYSVVTSLVVDGAPVDAVTTRTGFRQTAFEHGMIYLNGRVIQVHGYGQRTTNEWPAVGLSVPPWMSDLSNRLMLESNANLVRWMHVTPWKQDVESADRLGLIESMPAGDAEGDSTGRHWQQRVELMRDAIIYNRNNPSILFYESGNKGVAEEHILDMKRVRDEYDPHGGRAVGAREMLASHDAEYGGEMLYIDKSSTKPLWSHEYDRDEGARKFQDDDTPPFHQDSPLYNRNQDSFALEDIRRWYDYYAERPGTGTRVSSGGVNIIFSDSNTHYRGDNNYRRSGEVDAMRLPKEGFYAHQVMWNGWVDVERPGIHILGHWNYPPHTVRPVYVVSTGDKVELRLNGRSLGFGAQSDRFLFAFDHVAYQPGELQAIAYDSAGKIVATTAVTTAGTPSALKLTLHTGPAGLRADGADMALVDVEVVDNDGRRCPTALNMVSFSLDGAVEWRGGIAQGSATPAPINTVETSNTGLAATPATPLLHEDNYILSRNLPVEGGVNRVILRSLPHAGAIHLEAKADGLRSASIAFASHAVAVQDGLSMDFPANDEPLDLDRGPTPATPSFVQHRFAIPIASAAAGANADRAGWSYDDDETTSWSSAEQQVTDGIAPKSGQTVEPVTKQAENASLSSAWIEYTFAKPEHPAELELKLNGFRQRRYPLRVTLDGRTVWEGLTPTSLGYITLTLKPGVGARLRIALTGPPVDGGQFAGIVELAAQSPPPGSTTPASTEKPILSVIEAEVYR